MKAGTLLIVDDEELLVEQLGQLLAPCASKVLVAYNGQQALDILKSQPVHCVLSDIKMPVMDGVELIKRTRGLGNQVPFIFYSGHGNRELLLEVTQYGVLEFLNKPLLTGLREAVTHAMRVGVTQNQRGPSEVDPAAELERLLKSNDTGPEGDL